MFRKLIIFSLVVLFSGNVGSQVSGYMGKKVVVGYGFYIDPAITAAWYDYGTNVINTQHEFFWESR